MAYSLLLYVRFYWNKDVVVTKRPPSSQLLLPDPFGNFAYPWLGERISDMSICCHDMSVCLDPSYHEINPHSHGQNISSIVSVKYLVAMKSRLIDRGSFPSS